MNTAREFALELLQKMYKDGHTLADILSSNQGGGGPQSGDKPHYSYQMNWAYLYRTDETSLVIKRGQIGVYISWNVGRKDTGIFSIRELWKEITNPQPKQLGLFDEVQP